MSIVALTLSLLSSLGMLLPARQNCAQLGTVSVPRAASNDNRSTAGSMRDNVLSVRLVAIPVAWHPEGAQGCGLRVHAFAEEGKEPQIPGPLLRVRSGTEVHVVVRNALTKTLWIRGVQDRNVTALDSVEIAPGTSREFRFRATAPGAWYYWGGDANNAVPRSGVDGQLVGALVVDPPSGDLVPDRVFVMTRWTPNGEPGNRGFQLNAINGLSWPHTERLTQTVGDSVRWHVINAADDFHMMHLHGFYFRIDAHGNAVRDTVTFSTARTTVVTNVVRAGEWITLSWSPERAGNWLFHCHIVTHMAADQRLDRMPAAPRASESSTGAHGAHAFESMAGLILGVTVRSRESAPATETKPPRTLRLFANARPHVFEEHPGFGFVLQEGTAQPARDSIRIPGPPLVLTRGEPVQITVHNRLPQPLAVHWHGIELDSYFDGVPGWSGAGARIAPVIAPNDSFVVRFTPPRAGTFIYHVHNEHGEDLASGLYGALIVLERGKTYDPASDLLLVIATAGPGKLRPSFVNGRTNPDTLHLTPGKTYRLRVIDINANDAHRTALVGETGPLPWRIVARDGWDLPSDGAAPRITEIRSGPGVTSDAEFSLPSPGVYAVTVTHRAAGMSTGHVTRVPIRAR